MLEAIYVTLQEFKDLTILVNLPEDRIITNLIIKAQIIIDNYIGATNKTGENQDLKFPINGDTDIPTEIKLATIEIVQNLIITKSTNIASESWDGYSVNYNVSDLINNLEILNGYIRNLLKDYGINDNNRDLKAFKFNY